MREAVNCTQSLGRADLSFLVQDRGFLDASPPSKEIYEFKGTFSKQSGESEPLRLKNTMWANTVLAAGEAVGLVVYTGRETRIQMNARSPRTKVGKTDEEINLLSVLLFCFVMVLASSNLILSGTYFRERWYIYLFKNVLLLSSIIPISLRVNIDFAKIVYSLRVGSDPRLEGTVVRNTSIPEELGRLEFLLTDKTGTLTKNEMIFKRLSTPLASFSKDSLDNIKELLVEDIKKFKSIGSHSLGGKKKTKYNLVRQAVTGLMVCHNVTPTEDSGER